MSTPFNIDKDWRIAAVDERNWALQERKMREPEHGSEQHTATGGKKYEAWQDVGYSSTVEGVCRLWAQRTTRRSDKPLPVALADAIKGLDKVLKAVQAATKGL